MVSSHSGTPLGVGTSHGHFGPRDTPRLGPREYATTILPIVYYVTLGGTHTRMSLFPGTPRLESRNCPETVRGGVPGLWELITPDCGVWSRRSLNQTCSPHRHLSNDVSHSWFGGQEEVDSRLFDALPSHEVRPSWRSHKVKLRNQDLVARSRLPTLERGRGSSWEPRD